MPADEHGTSPPRCLEVPGYHPWRRHLHTSPDKEKVARFFFEGKNRKLSFMESGGRKPKTRGTNTRLLSGSRKLFASVFK